MDNQMSVEVTEYNEFQQFIYSGDMYIFYCLFILMAIDILSGWAKAFKVGNLWSRKSVYGAGRKMMVIFIVVIANMLDNIIQLHGAFLYGIMIYYIATEMLSITENLSELGFPIPSQIQEKLEVLKNKEKE